MQFIKAFLLLALFSAMACQKAVVLDPHSYSRPDLAVAKQLDLHLKVDFEQKILKGEARWSIQNHGSTEIIFDTRDLNIEKISLGKEATPAQYSLDPADPILGAALRVKIAPGTDLVTIHYATKPEAAALGWMEPSQTAGKKSPFLFTQGQAILTRSWIPCQDSPGNRVTYTATIEAPVGTMAVMSAENPQQKSPNGVYQFRMEQPISPYLIALAVGDIEFQSISPRTGVYAEPSMLAKVAWEFADMEKMVATAESLYGPYAWGRYDLIVLPPGFPFGGMENPRLTFATPTVVTGDRSMVALVAHELAHSWSGNLVTNATWDDFWLNEGFTVYFERRIMEALYGKEYTEMLAVLEEKELADEVADLGKDSPDTALKLHLKGRDPDEGMNDIAYQKGNFFLQMLELKLGRERFDPFLKGWFEEHKFQALTTEDFLAYLQQNLLDKYKVEVNVHEWVYEPGIPSNCPKPVSAKLVAAQAAAVAVAEKLPQAQDWSPHEWVQFVRYLPNDVAVPTLAKIDAVFQLSDSGNAEITCAWYDVAIRRGYSPAILPKIESFLEGVGRRRFLMPLYRAFKESGQLDTANRIFEKAKVGYHAVSRESIGAYLKE